MFRNLLLILLLLSFCCALQAQRNSRPPNIVIIFADDLGWADLAVYGSTFYETPNLDKLAAGGIRFTQGYASSPVCSPTRASMMTGKYPVKTGVTDWIRGRQENGKAKPYEKLVAKPTAYQLALSETTIAELALRQGYKTFFSGKWHLGEEEQYWPGYQGFQINKGGWSKGAPTGRKNDSTGGYFPPYANPKLSDGPPGEYLTDRLTDECLKFIEASGDFPFLLMYSLYAVHNPMQAPAPVVKKYKAKQKELALENEERFAKDEDWMKHEDGWKRRLVQDNAVYAAMVENMDQNVGRIWDKLKQAGLEENTLVIFTSDNGGLSTAEGSPTVNGKLRAGKGWLYEGGIRVPVIMHWKGKISAGLSTGMPVSTVDFFPTIAHVMNETYSKDPGVDGEDIFKLLKDSTANKNRPLFWHYPHYSNQGGKPGAAVREGQYKLLYNYEDKSVELYDIEKDLGEVNNISRLNKKVAKKLKQKVFRWLKQNNALKSHANPGYFPEITQHVKVK